MRRALPLPARLVLLVLLVVAAPLAFIGYWLAGTAARSGEDLLRTRLQRTNASVAAELAGNWIAPRSALLSFAEVEAVQARLMDRGSGGQTPSSARPPASSSSSTPPPELLAAFDSLPPSVLEVMVRASDGDVLWELARAPADAPTFDVRIPVHARGGERLGTIDARMLGTAVLGPEGVLSSAAGAMVAVLAPDIGASLRPLPLDPLVLAQDRFEWSGETWVAERQRMADPPLVVVSAAALAEFSAPFETAAGRGLGLLVVVAVLVTFLTAVLTRRMTRSLSDLAHAADAVRGGDLAARVPGGGRDEVGRVAEAFNDMTQSLRRTLSELSQREALARVGSFAAELAHEVRNPLTSIKLDLQHVEERLPEGSEVREVQRGALEEIGRLDRTVSGVLQIARSGGISLETVDLRDSLRAAAHTAEPLVREARATLRLDVGASPLLVRGDSGALQQLFTNLLVNAGQAVGSGGSVEVLAASDRGRVTVVIRDDGSGIPPEHLARVREPFYSTRPEGTGLGLAIADRIAAAHQAELYLESEPGRGTSVEVRFGPAEMSRPVATG